MSRKGFLLALPVVTFLFASCAASKEECSSSCGSVKNISYPFRLKEDPTNCGDHNYELLCQSNQAILDLYSRKYVVKSISYENQTVRVLDPGLQSNNCSSLPKYSLTWDDFYGRNNSYSFLMRHYGTLNTSYVSYLSCLNSVDDPSYIEASSCINSSGVYYYVLFNSTTAAYLKQSCSPIVIFPSNPSVVQNYSYIGIWTSLLMGFELSWRPVLCGDCDAAGGTCEYRYDYNPVQVCYHDCRSAFQSPKCFFRFFRWIIKVFVSRFFPKAGYDWDDGTTIDIPLAEFGFDIMIITGFILAGRTALGMLCFFSFLIYKFYKKRLSKNSSIEQFLEKYRNLMPTRYSYGEIKKMTSRFKETLGQGGYGTVFKGRLASGRPIAVKILGKSKGNGEEFISEVATIGRIHHINVVQLLGFCSDGSKRGLVYDYMPNSSLDKYIYSREGQSNALSIEKLYEIALGTARGIEYLHRGCDMQILHFDIKPHNVLLDANFTPKVSDFGLAKLYPTEHSMVSLSAAKGTIGYIAPEMIYRNFGRISYKSDVYSFGRLLLEMMGKPKNLEATGENSSLVYIPAMIYDQLMQGEDLEIGVMTESESELGKKMLIVGLWCVQIKPDDRPSMSRVIEMFEGSVEDLSMPHRPSLLFTSEGDEEILQSTETSQSLHLLEGSTSGA